MGPYTAASEGGKLGRPDSAANLRLGYSHAIASTCKFRLLSLWADKSGQVTSVIERLYNLTDNEGKLFLGV